MEWLLWIKATGQQTKQHHENKGDMPTNYTESSE